MTKQIYTGHREKTENVSNNAPDGFSSEDQNIMEINDQFHIENQIDNVTPTLSIHSDVNTDTSRLTNHHQDLTKLLENPYQCGICSKRFKKCSELSSHIEIHLHANKLATDKTQSCSSDAESNACTGASTNPEDNLDSNANTRTNTNASDKLESNTSTYINTNASDTLESNDSTCVNTSASDTLESNASTCVNTNASDTLESNGTTCVNTNATDNLHDCKTCGKIFNYHVSLERHMKVHTEDYTCKVCGRKYQKFAFFRKHARKCEQKVSEKSSIARVLRTHTGETRPYMCETCGKRFTVPSDLKRHIIQHTDERPYECNVCGDKFKQLGHLITHLTIHGPRCKPYGCEHCGKTFYYNNTRRRHIRDVHTSKIKLQQTPHGCDICDKRFPSYSDLERHIRKHTGEKPYECSVCGEKFKQVGHLIRHSKKHGTPCKPHGCEQCGKKFYDLNTLQRHITRHTGETPYSCENCGRKFTDSSNMCQHVKMNSCHKNNHKNKEDTRFQCGICEKVFETMSGVLKHEVLHKTAKTATQVEICETSDNLIIHHTKESEGGSPRHVSDNSSRKGEMNVINQDVEMENNEKTSDEVKTQANTQNVIDLNAAIVTVSEKSSLYSHRNADKRKEHTGSVANECKYCAKKLSNKGSLRRHIRIHTGETPYGCESCGRRFTDGSGFQNHVRRNSCKKYINLTWYECGICKKIFETKSGIMKHTVIHNTAKTCTQVETYGHEISQKNGMKANDEVQKHANENLSKTEVDVCYASNAQGNGIVHYEIEINGSNALKLYAYDKTHKVANIEVNQEMNDISLDIDITDAMHAKSDSIEKFDTKADIGDPVEMISIEKSFNNVRNNNTHGNVTTDDTDANNGDRKGSENSVTDSIMDTDFFGDLYLETCDENFLSDKITSQVETLSNSDEMVQEEILAERNLNQASKKQNSASSLVDNVIHGDLKHFTDSDKLSLQDIEACTNLKMDHLNKLCPSSVTDTNTFVLNVCIDEMAYNSLIKRKPVVLLHDINEKALNYKNVSDEAILNSCVKMCKRNISFECQTCGKRYKLRRHLLNHVKKHPPIGPYACITCGKMFRTYTLLNAHMKTHMGQQYQCEHCGKTYRSMTTLNAHRSSIHTGDTQYICKVCGKKCGLKKSLEMHLKVHTGERPFQCSICGQCFGYLQVLKNHNRIHTGELFSCNECTMHFQTKANLRRHMTYKHSNEKPYSCKTCQKCFARQDDLKKHMIVHTGEKRFKCDICNKAFAQGGHVTRHLSRVHRKEKPYGCMICAKHFSDKRSLTLHLQSSKHKQIAQV